jgi:putative transposase
MLLSKKIRLQVGEQDAATLEMMQGKCRGLYNWWVMKLRAGERWNWRAAKKTLAESRTYDPQIDQVYGKLLAEVYFRLDKAMQAFFQRVANGETPGFPRVRPRHQFFTLCYPAMYIKVQGKTVLLPTGGGQGKKNKPYPTIRAELTESVPAGYKEVAISRDARDHYHTSFVYEVAEEAESQAEHIVAFDLGIKTLATGVNQHGRFYHVGGFKGYQWYNKQLDKIRSKRDHCKKRSRRYIHLCQVYQRVSEQKRNKRRDGLHKASHLIAHRLVERTVLIGDLSQRQMVTKDHEAHLKALHRSVYNDWGLYQFVQMLPYKCLLAGKALVKIDERDTSKACSGCGHMQAMPLHKRMYRCGACGLVMDRDENSAVNIRERYLARLGPHATDVASCAEVFTAIDTLSYVEKGRGASGQKAASRNPDRATADQ